MFEGTKGVKLIFYTNIAVFTLSILLGLIGINLYESLAAYNYNSDNFHVYQLITYQFMHGGFMHIIFNMLAFISLAPFVEKYLGTNRFYVYYLLSGIVSALFHMIMVSNDVPLVGASGSIFSVIVMFGLITPNEKLSLMFLPWGFKAKYIIGTIVLIEVISAMVGDSSNISHWGHIGGSISGLILFIYEKYINKNLN